MQLKRIGRVLYRPATKFAVGLLIYLEHFLVIRTNFVMEFHEWVKIPLEP